MKLRMIIKSIKISSLSRLIRRLIVRSCSAVKKKRYSQDNSFSDYYQQLPPPPSLGLDRTWSNSTIPSIPYTGYTCATVPSFLRNLSKQNKHYFHPPPSHPLIYPPSSFPILNINSSTPALMKGVRWGMGLEV